jgi:hypothetical protein
VKTDTQLDQLVESLSREITPRRDLWAGIEARLDEQTTSGIHSRKPARFFAHTGRWAAVLAVALLGVLWLSEIGIDPAVRLEQPAMTTAQNGEVPEPVSADQQIAAVYAAIKSELLSGLGLVSADFGDWQYQLTIWDQALGEVRDALNYYPEEPALLAQMEGIYQQQIEYLQWVGTLDSGSTIWMEN